jgi:enamine deaminase RidA (YjgF/YER057c/UK114 family)
MTVESVAEQIVTDQAPPPAGHYSQGLVRDGLVWVAGQTPRLADGTRLNHEPFEVQARQALRNVDAVAAAAGSSLAHALQVTVFLVNPEDRFTFDEVWCEFVSEPYPTRAVVQSDLPGFALEVVAVCAVPLRG